MGTSQELLNVGIGNYATKTRPETDSPQIYWIYNPFWSLMGGGEVFDQLGNHQKL